ncbi:MAG: HAD hydrolase-like protein, partial [Candidatus Aminicenantes bacterium]|nr:HAD hydrolase-like protein [Candidatus Aminicenantes bacterium]
VDGVLIDDSQSYHLSLAETSSYFLQRPIDLKEARQVKIELGINNDWDATLACILFHRSGRPWEKFRSFFTSGLADFHQIYRLAEQWNVVLPDYRTVIEEFENSYRKYRDREELRIPPPLLAEIKKETDLLAVITGRTRQDLEYSFVRFSLSEYFDVVLTEDDLPSPEFRKPSPYLLKKLLDGYGSSCRACYVGDSLADKLMVENYNQETKKNVSFILFRHALNQHISSCQLAFTAEEVLEKIKEIKKS